MCQLGIRFIFSQQSTWRFIVPKFGRGILTEADSKREDEALIRRENRLSRSLDDEDFAEWMNEEICRLGTSKMTGDMVIGMMMFAERIFLLSKRFFGVPSFFDYPIADRMFNLLYPNKTALWAIRQDHLDDFQLCFGFG